LSCYPLQNGIPFQKHLLFENPPFLWCFSVSPFLATVFTPVRSCALLEMSFPTTKSVYKNPVPLVLPPVLQGRGFHVTLPFLLHLWSAPLRFFRPPPPPFTGPSENHVFGGTNHQRFLFTSELFFSSTLPSWPPKNRLFLR